MGDDVAPFHKPLMAVLHKTNVHFEAFFEEGARPPYKLCYEILILLISQPKHMLWILKRTVSMRWFF